MDNRRLARRSAGDSENASYVGLVVTLLESPCIAARTYIAVRQSLRRE